MLLSFQNEIGRSLIWYSLSLCLGPFAYYWNLWSKLSGDLRSSVDCSSPKSVSYHVDLGESLDWRNNPRKVFVLRWKWLPGKNCRFWLMIFYCVNRKTLQNASLYNITFLVGTRRVSWLHWLQHDSWLAWGTKFLSNCSRRRSSTQNLLHVSRRVWEGSISRTTLVRRFILQFSFKYVHVFSLVILMSILVIYPSII